MSEQTKLETDIPALRASIESLHGLIDDGDMLLIDCVPDLLDVLDELERLRAERPGPSVSTRGRQAMSERLSDMDLEALAFTYEQNPRMIFSAQVVDCLRELQRLRAERPGWRPLAWAVLTEEGQLFSVHTSERNAQMAFGSASREIVPLFALHPSVAEVSSQ